MRKAYLDANILLALVAGEEKEPDQYKLALRVLQEIKDGKILGVISSLTLMEILAVLRTQKGREKEKLAKLSPTEQLGYVLSESKAMYDTLMAELLRLPNIKFEQGKHSDLNKLLDKAFEIMENNKGKVRFYTRCSRCGSKYVNYSAYKGLGSDDIIHALLARDIGCEELITFDGDFEVLKGMGEISPLEIRVIKW